MKTKQVDTWEVDLKELQVLLRGYYPSLKLKLKRKYWSLDIDGKVWDGKTRDELVFLLTGMLFGKDDSRF